MPSPPDGTKRLRTRPPAASFSPADLSSLGTPSATAGHCPDPGDSELLPVTPSAPGCPPQPPHLLLCFPGSHPPSWEAPGPTFSAQGLHIARVWHSGGAQGNLSMGVSAYLVGSGGARPRLSPPRPPPSSLPGLQPPACLGCCGPCFLAVLEALSPTGGPVWLGLPGGRREVRIWVGIRGFLGSPSPWGRGVQGDTDDLKWGLHVSLRPLRGPGRSRQLRSRAVQRRAHLGGGRTVT